MGVWMIETFCNSSAFSLSPIMSSAERNNHFASVASVVSDSVRPHRRLPSRLPRPWDSPGKNTGVGCHFLLQCRKVKSEREVAQSCPTLATPWTAAYQAPPSMGFSRQKYWSRVPLPSLQRSPTEALRRNAETQSKKGESKVSEEELCFTKGYCNSTCCPPFSWDQIKVK